MKNALRFFHRSHPHRASCLSIALAAVLPFAVNAAGLYKCVGDGGVPIYQNAPCEKGKELRDMSKDDTLSVIPMRVEPFRPTPPVAPPAVAPPAPLSPAVPLPAVPATPLTENTAAPRSTEAMPGNVQIAPLQTKPPVAPAIAVLPFPDVKPADAINTMTPLGAAAVARMAIKPGMNAADVEAKLGPPPMTGGAGSDAPEQPMRWFYLPVEGDKDTITTIVIQRGKVIEVERKPVKDR